MFRKNLFLIMSIMVFGLFFAQSTTAIYKINSDTSATISLTANKGGVAVTIGCSNIKSLLSTSLLSGTIDEESKKIWDTMDCKETSNDITLSFKLPKDFNKTKIGFDAYAVKKADGDYIVFEMNNVNYNTVVVMPSEITSHNGELKAKNEVFFGIGTKSAYAESKKGKFDFEIMVYVVIAIALGYAFYKILTKPGFLEGKGSE